jgi:DNA-binding transcriptional ArsR family regulator
MSRRSASARSAREQLDEIDAVFGALAHDTRRHILLVLRMRGGEMTSGEIAERFHCSWPTTTRHLRLLEGAGLVKVEARGRERVYRLNARRLYRVTRRWLRWFNPRRPARES